MTIGKKDVPNTHMCNKADGTFFVDTFENTTIWFILRKILGFFCFCKTYTVTVFKTKSLTIHFGIFLSPLHSDVSLTAEPTLDASSFNFFSHVD